ncbi:GrpB family protein [Colwellia psychrerythraea]|uniref:GrpB family protein n=1 Tax=Colwellia psychrerythraea TaxID=28229 RepID=A0A099K905_COLPS|nr:GrpB family protein [Colwellia psychrerythraea]KGJ86765.1 protein of unknown function UPF0157 [Colwellia psychrerythraea]
MTSRVIEVVSYDPRWVRLFESEKVLLAEAIGQNALKIEHIGSTSVVGLSAKPVIDILIEVTCLTELDKVNKHIETLGYLVKGENGITGRRYFQKGGVQHSHHIHAFQTDDMHLCRHRAFKEYLIAHPKTLLAYDKVKRMAASQSGNNIQTYMMLKNDFIQKHEQLAIRWFSAK